MIDRRHLDELVRARYEDTEYIHSGKDIHVAYVELELAGEDLARVHSGNAIHLPSSPGCHADHGGLLEAVRRWLTATHHVAKTGNSDHRVT